MAKKATSSTPIVDPPTKWEKLLKEIREGVISPDTNASPKIKRKVDLAITALNRLQDTSRYLVSGTWDGSENVIPQGTPVVIHAIAFNPSVFARSPCWVSWYIEPTSLKYLSCDLADIQLNKLDELELYHKAETYEHLLLALKAARPWVLKYAGDDPDAAKDLEVIDRALGIYEIAQS